MNILQVAFDKAVDKALNPDTLRDQFVIEKLKNLGFIITDEQADTIREQLRNTDNTDQIEIVFPGVDGEPVNVGSQEELNDFLLQVREEIEALYAESIENAAETMLVSLKKNVAGMLREHKATRKGFEKDITAVWGKPLRLLEMLLVIAREAGDRINDELREKAVEEENSVFEVVARLHARACQVGYEILTLLKAGYADGAHARWRSLHELATIAYFIKDKGKDVAERYIDHQGIVVSQAATLYETYSERLDYETIPESELIAIKSKKDTLKRKYGEDFSKEYGWASGYINNNPNPNFTHIEAAVLLDHFRPFYKLASHNVHAGPMRMHNSLGTTNINDDRMLTGPSILGLAIPIDSTAISMMQITTAFLDFEKTIDNQSLGKILKILSIEVSDMCSTAGQVSESNVV